MAVRKYRSAMSEYQPIAAKHEEQEKAVTAFVKGGQVHVYNIYIFQTCMHQKLYRSGGLQSVQHIILADPLPLIMI